MNLDVCIIIIISVLELSYIIFFAYSFLNYRWVFAKKLQISVDHVRLLINCLVAKCHIHI